MSQSGKAAMPQRGYGSKPRTSVLGQSPQIIPVLKARHKQHLGNSVCPGLREPCDMKCEVALLFDNLARCW